MSLAGAIRAGDPAAISGLLEAPIALAADNLVARPWAGGALGPGFGERFELAADPADPETAAHPSLAVLEDGSRISLLELLERLGPRILGERLFRAFGPRLPLLPKTLSIAELLSVQAHPAGHPEAYVILRADPGATLRLGFARRIDRATFAAKLEEGRRRQEALLEAAPDPRALDGAAEVIAGRAPIAPLAARFADPVAAGASLEALRALSSEILAALHEIPVAAGQVLWNATPGGHPTAEVHALGNDAKKELVLFELRRPGPTHRAWDHARFPLRALDVPRALDAMSLEPRAPESFFVAPRPLAPGVERLVECPSFTLDRLTPPVAIEHPDLTSLHVLEGLATIAGREVGPGETRVIPAGLRVEIAGAATLLHAAIASVRPAFLELEPVALGFGTSGLRGRVVDMSDLEVHTNVRGFLAHLEAQGAVAKGGEVFVGRDLRAICSKTGVSSSPRIERAVARAVEDAGFVAVGAGVLPTPALAAWALRKAPCIMVTGSHIPADRNGVKFYRPDGEVLKADEAPILAEVAKLRRSLHTAPPAGFDARGMLSDARPLRPRPEIARAYVDRYAFPGAPLAGRRIVVYEHSAAGRDLLVEILRRLGAEIVSVGRSEHFVAVDTEDVSVEEERHYAGLVAAHSADALVSTDGDGDRPLLVDDRGRFHRGDVLGAIVAEALDAEVLAVPVSVSDAVDRHFAGRPVKLLKTRIGSPYVIEAMNAALAAGARRVVGWEANGGFLLGADFVFRGRPLSALPTRDAALPLVVALLAAEGTRLSACFDRLPRRATRAGLLDEFPQAESRAILAKLSRGAAEEVVPDAALVALLAEHFTPARGFGRAVHLSCVDGVRITFDDGEIAHLRASGNAPQLRMYSVADTAARADEMIAHAIAEPDGILRGLARALG